MTKPGLWITVDEALQEAVIRSIESKECFTTTVAAWEFRPRPTEIVAVAFRGGSLRYIGICQRGRLVATGQVTVLVTNLMEVHAIRPEEIITKLPKRFRERFKPPVAGVYRPTPRLWEEILNIISRTSPEAHSSISEMHHVVAASKNPGRSARGGIEVFERDAIASALESWGGAALRKRELRKLTPVAPFLASLKSAYVREDPQVNHDHIVFPGMQLSRADVVGSVVLSDYSRNECLTILNCNRQPLEQTIGVDLVYYNHTFDSFVFVQYKRMTDSASGIAEYRPDSDHNHADELRRMKEIDERLNTIAGQDKGVAINHYRLSSAPFYLKLCQARVKAILDAGLVAGMYFPLSLWLSMLDSPDMRGPRGGVVMNWDKCRRRIRNSEFCRMLREGWIGTSARQSQYLNDLIEQSLSGRRMVVIGSTTDGYHWNDARRDNMGRFAAKDDPEGAV